MVASVDAVEPTSESELERLLESGTETDVVDFLRLLSAPEIADLLETLPDGEARARAFRLVEERIQSRVLREMDAPERADLVDTLPTSEAASFLEQLHTDDAADLIQSLDEDRQQELLGALDPKDRADLQRVLDYPADSAGGIMQTELVKVRATMSVRDAIEEIRRTADVTGELHEVFVVDDEGHLLGWVKERALLLADDGTPISSILRPVPIRVPAHEDQEDIASMVRDYDVSSVPVVDESDRLLGRILVDDILDVMHEEATEDLLHQGGAKAAEIDDPTVFTALKSRVPWLLVTFAGGIAAALIMGAAEDGVRRAGTLFAFIPVIMGMGGASGTQTATVTVRSLVTGRIGAGDIASTIVKEICVGLLLAAVTGLLLLAFVALHDGDPIVAAVAAGALFGTIALGTLFGVLTPLALDRLGADPAVAAGPFVTTVNDLLGSTIIWGLCWFALGA